MAIQPETENRDHYDRDGKHEHDEPGAAKVYVTNMVSGTVSVIDPRRLRVTRTIEVGTEPFGCALSPDGRKLYVTNQSQNTISVISTRLDRVVDTIRNVGVKPHGIAVSPDGDKLYVTQLLSARPAPQETRPEHKARVPTTAASDSVTVIDAHWHKVIGTVILNPILVAPFFQSDGNTLGREPLTTTFDNRTSAFPNLLESIVIRGKFAYVTGTCSSPNGPFRFNVNVQSCLSVIDTQKDQEAFPSLNMNDGINFEPAGVKLFNTNPFATVFKRRSREGFVAVGATNRLLRLELDSRGVPSINAPINAQDPGHIIRIELRTGWSCLNRTHRT